MKLRPCHKAQSFVEYALLLSLVLAALGAMNIYAKRSIQAKVKDMTDFFISPEQVADTYEDITYTSTTDSWATTDAKRTELGEGRMRLEKRADSGDTSTSVSELPEK